MAIMCRMKKVLEPNDFINILSKKEIFNFSFLDFLLFKKYVLIKYPTHRIMNIIKFTSAFEFIQSSYIFIITYIFDFCFD